MLSNYYGLNNIFCLYRLLIDDENMVIQKPEERLLEFNDVDCESKVVIRVTDTDEFLRRLDAAADKLLKEHKIEYSIYGNVAYESQWTNADGPGVRCAFHKEPTYFYQKEWRLCILQYALSGGPFVFEMVDLTKITEVISLRQFLFETESLYPGYTAVQENILEPEPVYKTAGMIDAVSHLMFSYTDMAGKQFVRSDAAQADWHYAQYLKLSDREAEIDDFLGTQMRKCQDIDHMELLVEYRLAIGAWVKATDAFMYFIKEVPSAVEKDPGRFFFPLHLILMSNRKATDAAKLYRIADKDYQIPEDLKETMLIDVLFANGFYDKAVPILENRQLNSPDPVLDYDLAVSYLHLLKFDKAEEHLTKYERYFSHTSAASERTMRFRKYLGYFYYGNLEQTVRKQHWLEGLEWSDKLEQLLRDTKAHKASLGIEFLYRVARAGKWELLNKFLSIEICPLTVSELMSMYDESGDPVLSDVIRHISQMDQVKIVSPEMMSYLAVDLEDESMPGFYKMERARQI